MRKLYKCSICDVIYNEDKEIVTPESGEDTSRGMCDPCLEKETAFLRRTMADCYRRLAENARLGGQKVGCYTIHAVKE